MNETEFETLLADLFGAEGEDVRTFREAGVLTSDAGLVVRLTDGSEFQVTVVRSN